VRGVPSLTAEVVCWMRAAEQRRPAATRILDDPYAHLFLTRRGRAALRGLALTGPVGEWAERITPGLSAYVVARHRFIDDALRASLAREEGPRIEQVLLLGAGYDTRAHRFAAELRGARVFEVDHPATSARKARVVARLGDALPTADVVRVPVDFEHDRLDERLRAAGFVENRPTFVVWEGVSMYLTRRAVEGTLGTIVSLVAPGSELALDLWFLLDEPDLASTLYRLTPHALHLIGEPITFGIHPDDIAGFLDRAGFALLSLCTAEGLEARYVRDGRRIYPANYVAHARVRGPR
jgi:methyltransferase (TIGR00027 family)